MIWLLNSIRDASFSTDAIQNHLFFIAFIFLSRKRKEQEYQGVIYIMLDFTAVWHCEWKFGILEKCIRKNSVSNLLKKIFWHGDKWGNQKLVA